MITPMEITRVRFSKSLRGYNEREVDDFLYRLSRDFDELYRENHNLKDKIKKLTNQIETYQEMERNLKKTLISAQRTSSEIREDAERKAEIIIQEAELNAERIVEEARKEVKQLNNKIHILKKKYKEIKRDLLSVIERYKIMVEADNE